MPKERILDRVEFSYEGLMEFDKIYKEMYSFWKEKDFDILEMKHEEKMQKDGSKKIHLEWSCERKVTDYAKYYYFIMVDVENLRKVVIKSGNLQREMETGKIKYTLYADLELDYNQMFGGEPKKWVLRAFLEKFIWKSEIDAHKKNVKKIGYEFLNRMQEFLNTFRTPI